MVRVAHEPGYGLTLFSTKNPPGGRLETRTGRNLSESCVSSKIANLQFGGAVHKACCERTQVQIFSAIHDALSFFDCPQPIRPAGSHLKRAGTGKATAH